MGRPGPFVKSNSRFPIAFVSGVLIILASTPQPRPDDPPMTRTPASPIAAPRSASARLALVLAILPVAPLAAKDWDLYTLGGREYVSDENVAKFYGFERFAKQGDDRIFKHPTLIMTWRVGSESIYVNNIKFCLSFPIVENGGMAMLSTVDLAKLVDPVVRPSYIRKPIEFDTVVIDAGHGAHDSGAKGPYGREKDYTLDTSLRLEKALQARGFKTVMTRREDVFLTLGQRVEVANRQRNAIFISIHYNSSGAKTSNGIETYALAPQGTRSTNGGSPWNSSLTGNISDAENIALATAVHAHVISDIKTVDRGIKRARFNVLRGINKPGILFEGGFVTNPTEAKLINDPAHRERLANSIADAVVRFKVAVGKK